jgi:hypothetical protein
MLPRLPAFVLLLLVPATEALHPAAQPGRLAAPVQTAAIAPANAAQSVSAAANCPTQLGRTSCWAVVCGAGPAEHLLSPQTRCPPALPLLLPFLLLPLLLLTVLPVLPHHQTCHGPSHAQALQGPDRRGGCAAVPLLLLLLPSCISALTMLPLLLCWRLLAPSSSA